MKLRDSLQIGQHPALKYGNIFDLRPAGDMSEIMKASEQRRSQNTGVLKTALLCHRRNRRKRRQVPRKGSRGVRRGKERTVNWCEQANGLIDRIAVEWPATRRKAVPDGSVGAAFYEWRT